MLQNQSAAEDSSCGKLLAVFLVVLVPDQNATAPLRWKACWMAVAGDGVVVVPGMKERFLVKLVFDPQVEPRHRFHSAKVPIPPAAMDAVSSPRFPAICWGEHGVEAECIV